MAPPPTVQRAPMTALPAMPTQPAIAECAPILHVVADLDEVVELDAVLDHGVVERAPRSMQVLAPISTSSPMRTPPSCSIFS